MNITEQACAEAEKLWPSNVSNGLSRANNAISRDVFMSGVKFGYAARAAEEPNDEQVRAVLRVMHQGIDFGNLDGYPEAAERARAALRAARDVNGGGR